MVVLQRNAAFPQDRINEIYGCDEDDFDEPTLTRLRREANQLATVFGAPPAGGAAAGRTWRISDTSHEPFGKPVPEAALGNEDVFISRGSCALVEIDEVSTTAGQEEDQDQGEDGFLRRFTTGPGRDSRILADQRDAYGSVLGVCTYALVGSGSSLRLLANPGAQGR